MPNVLIVQNIWGDPPGLVAELLENYHVAFDLIQVPDQSLPTTLAGYRALIVLGGPQSANDEFPPYFVQEKRLLEEALAEEIPYLGLCLGGQLLAVIAKGSVEVGTATEIGFVEVTLTEEGLRDPLFAQWSTPRHQVFHWHHDTFRLPPGAVLLETGDSVPYQSFRYGPRAYGCQYHMELTREMFDLWLHEHPEKEQAITLLGTTYQEIIDDVPRLFPYYREQSTHIFTNFLRLSHIVS